MSLDALVRTAERAVTETGKFLRSLASDERGVAATEIDGREVKLHVDRRAHDRLSELLADSGVPVVSEEEKASHGANLDEVWVIDHSTAPITSRASSGTRSSRAPTS